MTPADRERISRAVVRTERQPLGNPLDDGTADFIPPGAYVVEARVTGSDVCNVTNLSGASDEGGGPCDGRLWPAVVLRWNQATRCFTDADLLWLFDLNDTDLELDTRYAVKILESGFKPQCSNGSGASGASGSGEAHEARTLAYVMPGSSGGPTVDLDFVTNICELPDDAELGSGSGVHTG